MYIRRQTYVREVVMLLITYYITFFLTHSMVVPIFSFFISNSTGGQRSLIGLYKSSVYSNWKWSDGSRFDYKPTIKVHTMLYLIPFIKEIHFCHCALFIHISPKHISIETNYFVIFPLNIFNSAFKEVISQAAWIISGALHNLLD